MSVVEVSAELIEGWAKTLDTRSSAVHVHARHFFPVVDCLDSRCETDQKMVAEMRALLQSEPTCPNCRDFDDEHEAEGCTAVADDAECHCAMTESSQNNCPEHGTLDVIKICDCPFPRRTLDDLRALLAADRDTGHNADLRAEVNRLRAANANLIRNAEILADEVVLASAGASLEAENRRLAETLTEADATISRAMDALGVDHPVWLLLDDYDGSMDNVKALVAEAEQRVRALLAAEKDTPAQPRPRVWNAGDPEPDDVREVWDKSGDQWTRCGYGWRHDTPVGEHVWAPDWEYLTDEWAPLTDQPPAGATQPDGGH